MQGIGYDAEAIIYNSTGGELGNPRKWYGTRLEKVRVELTQKLTTGTDGTATATVCTIKIHDADLPKQVVSRQQWQQDPESSLALCQDSIFVITKKADLNRDVIVPVGEIADADYAGGFLNFLRTNIGMTYKASMAEHYSLIPHWVVSGA